MFLKLPKLFNFHILRLAAEQEIKQRQKRKHTKTSVEKRRWQTFNHLHPQVEQGNDSVSFKIVCFLWWKLKMNSGFTFSLADGYISSLIHVLLLPVLLPVAHGGRLAKVFPREQSGCPFQSV